MPRVISCDCCGQYIIDVANTMTVIRDSREGSEERFRGRYCDRCTKRILRRIDRLRDEMHGKSFSQWAYDGDRLQ